MTTLIDRRNFIATAATAAPASAIGANTPLPQYPKLVHHVFFWLKNPNSQADLEKLLAGLRTLVKIETVRGAHLGVPARTEKREVVDNTYSVSELLFFDDIAGQNIYQEHPVHKQFVAECSPLWEKVLVYDTIER